jgi:hypothetical protein
VPLGQKARRSKVVQPSSSASGRKRRRRDGDGADKSENEDKQEVIDDERQTEQEQTEAMHQRLKEEKMEKAVGKGQLKKR